MFAALPRRSLCLLALVLSVGTLLVLGMVMLYSTSSFAPDGQGNAFFFLKRQTMWLFIGLVVCAVAAKMHYRFWERTCWIWYALAIILLILCFVPPIGQRINGSARWIRFATFTFQPSELAKLAVIATVAWWFARDERAAGEFLRGFIYPFAIAGALMLLIAPEVDMGSTALIGATTFVVMFVAGTKMRYLVPLVVIGVAALGFAIYSMPERTGRFLAFMYPDQYPADAYQTQQGLIAFGSGGVDGLGLGNGRQKMSYLPFAHTDFIFPMIGEELGLKATLGVVFAYIVFIFCGTTIALQARDRFGMLFGFGFVIIIALQAAINIGVTTSLLPNKGLPLPFISYGGSNLVFCLLGVGVLINLYTQADTRPLPPGPVRLQAHTGKRAVRI